MLSTGNLLVPPMYNLCSFGNCDRNVGMACDASTLYFWELMEEESANDTRQQMSMVVISDGKGT